MGNLIRAWNAYFFRCYKLFVYANWKNVGKLIIFLAACFACAQLFLQFHFITYARPVRFKFSMAILYEFSNMLRNRIKHSRNFESFENNTFSFLSSSSSFFLSKCFFNRTSHRIRVSLFNPCFSFSQSDDFKRIIGRKQSFEEKLDAWQVL